MYHSWLDRWDERRAQHGEEGKRETEFGIGAELAFPSGKTSSDLAEFCDLADQAVADPSFYSEPNSINIDFERESSWVRFPSDMPTEIKENNVVWAKLTDGGSIDRALVVFHHWNANSRYSPLADFLSKRGITVVEITLPYHFERSRPGSSHADYFLSPNLGRTVQSVRQGVWDGRKLIRWLRGEGYENVSVLGMSLGSWVAALVAAHDPAVAKAALFLTGGSAADVAWTGRATRFVRQSLEPDIQLTDLRKAWAPLNLENYVHKLARPDLDLQVVLAKRDKVVLPEISASFLEGLIEAGGRPSVLEMNCGHYSLAMPPYSLRAGLNLKRLLS